MQRTRFSSGVEVTVNYGEFPYPLEDGGALPGHGFRVADRAAPDAALRGRLELRIEVER